MAAPEKKSGSKLPHSIRSYLQDKLYHRLRICQERFWAFWRKVLEISARGLRQALLTGLHSLDPQGVHGGNGGGAVGGNDGGEKGANGERASGDGQGKRIPGGDAIELGGDESSSADSQGQAEEQADQYALESPAQYESKDFGAVGTKGHANADFVGALGDGIGGDAVKANRGK